MRRNQPTTIRGLRSSRAAGAVAVLLLGCCSSAHAGPGRVLVLGIDGMDPRLAQTLMDAGRMPNFSQLAARGSFAPLGTSMPPQSPVAWSNVISGAAPDTHEIYDFIHRHPDPDQAGLAIEPYLSTAETLSPENKWEIPLGRWRLPLVGDSVLLLRQGGAFWDVLVEAGVKTTIYRMPANYPPPQASGRGLFSCLCGMGTPDVRGTYGVFTLYTPHAPLSGRQVSGGQMRHWFVRDHRAKGTLTGPANVLLAPDNGNAPLTVDFQVVRDPEADAVKIEIQDQVAVLNAGDWSDWIAVDLETGIPGSAVLSVVGAPTSVPAMVRFFVKEVHPDLEVYVTPLNIDPKRPANPISTPGFAAQLAESTGRFFTTGIPQDTKALRHGALNEEQFLSQCRIVLDERIEQYRHALQRFDAGVLFFYFGAVDQLSHMFWRDQDPRHPGRRPDEAQRYGNVIAEAYEEMDGLVGEAQTVLDERDTLIVMSDHGFDSFRRSVNLNTWLLEAGYLRLIDPQQQTQAQLYSNVDWARTRAYALGLNGLYVNLRGREKYGIVEPGAAYDTLLRDLTRELSQLQDEDGSPCVARVYRVKKLYPQADPAVAPDLLVGYARGYRASWATALGGMPSAVIEDNLERWSGDHCNAHDLVPGILVTNRQVKSDQPTLADIGPSILSTLGLPIPDWMSGTPLFAPR